MPIHAQSNFLYKPHQFIKIDKIDGKTYYQIAKLILLKQFDFKAGLRIKNLQMMLPVNWLNKHA